MCAHACAYILVIRRLYAVEPLKWPQRDSRAQFTELANTSHRALIMSPADTTLQSKGMFFVVFIMFWMHVTVLIQLYGV